MSTSLHSSLGFLAEGIPMPMKDDARTPDSRNAPGGFYVLKDCCLLCGVPWEYAPELFDYDDNGCWVSRQPATRAEREKMLKVIAFQELDCVRSR